MLVFDFEDVHDPGEGGDLRGEFFVGVAHFGDGAPQVVVVLLEFCGDGGLPLPSRAVSGAGMRL